LRSCLIVILALVTGVMAGALTLAIAQTSALPTVLA